MLGIIREIVQHALVDVELVDTLEGLVGTIVALGRLVVIVARRAIPSCCTTSPSTPSPALCATSAPPSATAAWREERAEGPQGKLRQKHWARMLPRWGEILLVDCKRRRGELVQLEAPIVALVVQVGASVVIHLEGHGRLRKRK